MIFYSGICEASKYPDTSVADPHHIDADPDSFCRFDPDPDPSFQIKANIEKGHK